MGKVSAFMVCLIINRRCSSMNVDKRESHDFSIDSEMILNDSDFASHG